MSSEGFKTPSEISESEENPSKDGSLSQNQASDTYLSPPEYSSSLDNIRKSNESKKGRMIVPKVSDRLDFLALPKKDFLDLTDPQPRPDGTIPERGLPSWGFLPLQTKIPADGFEGHITMTKLGAQLYEPPPGRRFDQSDMYIRDPAIKTYDLLFDPNMKQHLSRRWERRNLQKRGFLSDSGRVITTLKKVNDFRVYRRRILAENTLQKYRDQDEAERLERERQKRQSMILEDEETKNRKCQTALRSYIKNVVANTNIGSMEIQRDRDMRVLNGVIDLQLKTIANAQATKPRRDEIFEKHLYYKYGSDDWKKDVHFAMDVNDIQRVKTVCTRQEKETIDKSLKKQDLFERKVDAEIEWLKRGMEVEHIAAKDREDRIRARMEGHPMKRTPGKNQQRSEQNEGDPLNERIQGVQDENRTNEVPIKASGKDNDVKENVEDDGVEDKSGLSEDENWKSAIDMPPIEKTAQEDIITGGEHQDGKIAAEDGDVQDETGPGKEENSMTTNDSSRVDDAVREQMAVTDGDDKDEKVSDEDGQSP